jgi:hypothetical protein
MCLDRLAPSILECRGPYQPFTLNDHALLQGDHTPEREIDAARNSRGVFRLS